MYFAIPKLTYLVIVFSCYNILTWAIDWFRYSFGYFGPNFFALIPQIALTIWLFIMIRNFENFNYRVSAPFIVFSLWILTILIGAAELFFPEELIPWPITYSILESVGFPILEIEFGGAAPFLGLFHNNQGELDLTKDWYFDGGVQFSWLAFNLLSTILLISLLQIAYEDIKEGRKPKRFN